jgi:hypothetical protein
MIVCGMLFNWYCHFQELVCTWLTWCGQIVIRLNEVYVCPTFGVCAFLLSLYRPLVYSSIHSFIHPPCIPLCILYASSICPLFIPLFILYYSSSLSSIHPLFILYSSSIHPLFILHYLIYVYPFYSSPIHPLFILYYLHLLFIFYASYYVSYLCILYCTSFVSFSYFH